VRIKKTDEFGGMPAALAREVVRHFQSFKPAQVVRPLFHSESGALRAVEALATEGFLEERERGADGERWWRTTIEGNALAMASFNRPIKRSTADSLVAGVVERAARYNENPERPFYVARLRLFGSYLRPDVAELGDVDLELTVGSRDYSANELLAYADASGRTFNSHLERISWPRRELVRTLRGRFAALNLAEEDVSALTTDLREIYSFAADPQS
jgi:hypothetical protein